MLKTKLTKISFGNYADHLRQTGINRNLWNKIEMKMATTTLQQSFATNYTERTGSSLWNRFIAWTKGQEKNRLMWLGIALSAHGCIITPLTIMAVLLAGTNLILFILAIVAMGASLVTNLAAMPTKITIPVFFFSIVLDIAIISSCAITGMDIANTYI
jgi:hypothetical protein